MDNKGSARDLHPCRKNKPYLMRNRVFKAEKYCELPINNK